MGLLDQVIGQVIGGMMGGAAGGRPAPQPQSGRAAPGGGGGLGDLLGGAAGKYSPLILALLSLLASKNLQSGAGGYGSILHDMFGKLAGGSLGLPGGLGGAQDERVQPGRWGTQTGDDEDGNGAAETDEPPTRRGGGRDGGFLDSVGSMLDRNGGSGSAGGATPQAGGQGRDGGMPGGFEDLFERFRRNGRGDLMESWVGSGPNKPASPQDLTQALGQDTIDQLAQATGIGRDQLLSQLSHVLPQVVDGLTPNGRAPTEHEQRSWI